MVVVLEVLLQGGSLVCCGLLHVGMVQLMRLRCCHAIWSRGYWCSHLLGNVPWEGFAEYFRARVWAPVDHSTFIVGVLHWDRSGGAVTSWAHGLGRYCSLLTAGFFLTWVGGEMPCCGPVSASNFSLCLENSLVAVGRTCVLVHVGIWYLRFPLIDEIIFLS